MMPEIKKFLEENKDRHYTTEECDYFNEAFNYFTNDKMDDREKKNIILFILCAYDTCEKELKKDMLKVLRKDLKKFKETYFML